MLVKLTPDGPWKRSSFFGSFWMLILIPGPFAGHFLVGDDGKSKFVLWDFFRPPPPALLPPTLLPPLFSFSFSSRSRSGRDWHKVLFCDSTKKIDRLTNCENRFVVKRSMFLKQTQFGWRKLIPDSLAWESSVTKMFFFLSLKCQCKCLLYQKARSFKQISSLPW